MDDGWRFCSSKVSASLLTTTIGYFLSATPNCSAPNPAAATVDEMWDLQLNGGGCYGRINIQSESEKHGKRCWSKRWLIWWHNSEAVSTNSCCCCDEQIQRQDERTCQRASVQKHVPPSFFYAAEVDLLQMTYILMQVKQIQQCKTSWMMQQINLQHCWLITFLWIYFNLSSIYLSIL